MVSAANRACQPHRKLLNNHVSRNGIKLQGRLSYYQNAQHYRLAGNFAISLADVTDAAVVERQLTHLEQANTELANAISAKLA